MRYVVAYDIENDRTRTRVSEVLEGYGPRVQKSVFECELEPADLDRLTSRLRRELEKAPEKAPGGSVRIYRLCASCLVASIGIGDVEQGVGDKPWIVI